MLFHVKSQSNCHSITMTKSYNVKKGEKSCTYCDKVLRCKERRVKAVLTMRPWLGVKEMIMVCVAPGESTLKAFSIRNGPAVFRMEDVNCRSSNFFIKATSSIKQRTGIHYTRITTCGIAKAIPASQFVALRRQYPHHNLRCCQGNTHITTCGVAKAIPASQLVALPRQYPHHNLWCCEGNTCITTCGIATAIPASQLVAL